MARKSAHDILGEWVGPKAGRHFAAAASGITLQRRKGGRWGRSGHLKVDQTIRQTHESLTAQGWTLVGTLRNPDCIPNSASKAEARNRARARKRETDQARYDRETAAESALDFSNYADLAAYVIRTRRTPHAAMHDPRLRYIDQMARFHGSSGYLGTALMARMLVDEAETKRLDPAADHVARILYGSATQAAEAWARTGILDAIGKVQS